jgi:hypothetical protein
MKEMVIGVLNTLGWAWWIKVTTETPSCTYYFGPFLSKKEALDSQSGYLEDIKSEGAREIVIEIERCKPTELTIFDELNDNGDFRVVPTFSSQPY